MHTHRCFYFSNFERIYRGWKTREMKSFLPLSPLLLTSLQNETNEWRRYNYQGKKKKKKKGRRKFISKIYFKKNIHCNIREIRCSIDSNKLIHAINLVYITWKIHVST